MNGELPEEEYTVRVASEREQAERVLKFFNRPQIKHDLHWFTHEDTIERARKRDDRCLYYISREDTVAAALMIWCQSRVLDEQEAQIRQIATDPEHRGQGLGRHLCTRAERFARQHNKKEMIADVAASEPAVGFWNTIGYSPQSEWETDAGRSMMRVRKPL